MRREAQGVGIEALIGNTLTGLERLILATDF